MADYVGVLAHLTARRKSLVEEMAAVDAAIAALRKIAVVVIDSQASPQPPVTASAYPIGTFTNMTMPQAIMRVLGDRGEAMTKAQIKAALVGAGKHAGTNIGSHIYNTLHRLSQNAGPIRREPNGLWSLREWQLKNASTTR